jgi:hypothetical protein
LHAPFGKRTTEKDLYHRHLAGAPLHAGGGSGKTHRWKHWQGAPSRPHFYCLEEVLVVWLLNAAHMKAVPGRKSDVRDAEWIAQLLEHGLLAPSFVPPPQIRRLRMLTRYRMQLMGARTRDTVRLELMLEDASIKLSSVASSLKTVSARAMLTAMIEVRPTRFNSPTWRRVGCGARSRT